MSTSSHSSLEFLTLMKCKKKNNSTVEIVRINVVELSLSTFPILCRSLFGNHGSEKVYIRLSSSFIWFSRQDGPSIVLSFLPKYSITGFPFPFPTNPEVHLLNLWKLEKIIVLYEIWSIIPPDLKLFFLLFANKQSNKLILLAFFLCLTAALLSYWKLFLYQT